MMSRCPHCGQTHGADNHFCTVTGQALDLGPRLIGQLLLWRYEVRTLLGEGPVGALPIVSTHPERGEVSRALDALSAGIRSGDLVAVCDVLAFEFEPLLLRISSRAPASSAARSWLSRGARSSGAR